MADTTFVDQTTIIPTEVMNDLNDLYYTTLGGVAGAGTITKVQFPATQVASADANALDDYEEGNWTPVLAGSTTAGTQTYTTQTGRYTKIGRAVLIAANIALSAKDSNTAGNLRITGLPFTGASFNFPLAVGQYESINLDTAGGYSQLVAQVDNGGTFITLFEAGDNVAAAALTAADFSASTVLYVSGVYFV